MAYVAASDIKDYGDWESDTDDVLLGALIARATAIIESFTGRRFEADTDIRYFDADADVENRYLYLDEDLAILDSDTIITNGDASSVLYTDVVAEPRNEAPHYALKMKVSVNKEWTYDSDAENAISIDGKWGYSVTPPDDIKHACIRLVSWLYKQRETDVDLDRPLLTGAGVTIMPSKLPADVVSILMPYRRGHLSG